MFYALCEPSAIQGAYPIREKFAPAGRVREPTEIVKPTIARFSLAADDAADGASAFMDSAQLICSHPSIHRARAVITL